MRYAVALCCGMALVGTYAWGNENDEELVTLAKEAVSDDSAIATKAIEKLRKAGPKGLETLLAVHDVKPIKTTGDEAQKTLNPNTLNKELPPSVKAIADIDPRLKAAIETVGGQKDCHISRLYWYTNLPEARLAAKQEGKPILALYMLGKLTDEFSCANSRFFRSTLYANAEISKVMRERFILLWRSVRPAPKVTIDFGDGRKLQCTVTGNSAHYLIDSEGYPIDALPGLYAGKAFLRWLDDAEALFRKTQGMPLVERKQILATAHKEMETEINKQWEADCKKLGMDPSGERLAERLNDKEWAKFAELHKNDVELDAATVAIIRRQEPDATNAARTAYFKLSVEAPMLGFLRRMQNSIALDTVKNEYTMHRTIHNWFEAGHIDDLSRLNDRVYSQLFLSPLHDPWLGLAMFEEYTALDNDGLAETKQKK